MRDLSVRCGCWLRAKLEQCAASRWSATEIGTRARPKSRPCSSSAMSRTGYPLAGCSPAEPASVSPDAFSLLSKRMAGGGICSERRTVSYLFVSAQGTSANDAEKTSQDTGSGRISNQPDQDPPALGPPANDTEKTSQDTGSGRISNHPDQDPPALGEPAPCGETNR